MNRKYIVIIISLFVLLSGVQLAGLQIFQESSSERAGDCTGDFEEVSDEKGLDFNLKTAENFKSQSLSLYASDYNRDGWPDLLAVGGHNPDEYISSIKLYRNDEGTFEEQNLSRDPVKYGHNINSAVFFDYNNDGWDDLMLFPIKDDPILLVNQNGTFTQRDLDLNMSPSMPLGATVADFNGDGHLDVFIFQNGDWSERLPIGYLKPEAVGNITDDNGAANHLLLNKNGSGFELAEDTGINGSRWTLAASAVDINDDGHPDIHVANDFNRDIIYINRGDGTFSTVKLGVKTDRNAMSSEVMDVNSDGLPDIFVTNIFFNSSDVDLESFANYLNAKIAERMKGNNLLINQGNGNFTDNADEYQVRKGGWGWAAIATDFDNDGDTDLFHTNSHFTEKFVENSSYTRYPYVALQNGIGGSYHARNASTLGFNESDGRAAVKLDFDRDGDMDILVGRNNGMAYLYENKVSDNNWLQVRVSGTEAQPAVGAHVILTVNGSEIHRRANAKVDLLSQDSHVLQFGLGEHDTVDQLQIIWPDDTKRTYRNLSANRRVIASPEKKPRIISLNSSGSGCR